MCQWLRAAWGHSSSEQRVCTESPGREGRGEGGGKRVHLATASPNARRVSMGSRTVARLPAIVTLDGPEGLADPEQRRDSTATPATLQPGAAIPWRAKCAALLATHFVAHAHCTVWTSTPSLRSCRLGASRVKPHASAGSSGTRSSGPREPPEGHVFGLTMSDHIFLTDSNRSTESRATPGLVLLCATPGRVTLGLV